MKSLTVLALASVALASPHGSRHSQLFGTGPRGTGGYLPKPTGGLYPGGLGNGTFSGANSTGTATGGRPALSTTVLPVLDSSVPTGKPQGNFQKPDTSENFVNDNVAAGGNANQACSVVTQTETSIQYVTVTAGQGKPTGAGSQVENNINLENVNKPSAAQFYERPTGGFNGGYGQPSQPADVPAATGGNAGQPTYGAPAPSSTADTGAGTGTGSGSGSGAGNSGSTLSGGKIGLSYNKANLLSPFEGTGISWAYNWAAKPDGNLPSGVEFVPMCWGSDSINTCPQEAAGASHVLGFNEPDHHEQAAMTAEAAAQGHIKALNPLGESGSLIGSPAITNGPAPMGIAYLESWFSACGGQCKTDFVTFHWYDSASNIAYFKKHVQDVIDVAAANGVSKVWLTEFGVTGGDEASFIKEATSWLDQQPAVEKYAYFMASEGKLVSGGSLSAAGKAYVGQA